MKHLFSKRVSFAGKSLLWSVLLYLIFMMVINWDEIINTRKAGQETPGLVHKARLLNTPAVNTNTSTIPVHIQSDHMLSNYTRYTRLIESGGIIIYKLIGFAAILRKE